VTKKPARTVSDFFEELRQERYEDSEQERPSVQQQQQKQQIKRKIVKKDQEKNSYEKFQMDLYDGIDFDLTNLEYFVFEPQIPMRTLSETSSTNSFKSALSSVSNPTQSYDEVLNSLASDMMEMHSNVLNSDIFNEAIDVLSSETVNL
jgi:hypothetical protein